MRPRWIRAGVVLTAAIVACKFTPGASPGDGGGSGSADAKLPDAGPCTAAGDTCANAATLASCAAVGASPTVTPCAWGCVTTGSAHCGELAPAGGGVTGSDADAAALGPWSAVTLGSATINSDDGTITGVLGGFGHGVRNGVTFFQFKQLTITGPITLAGSNAIALVADGAIDIEAPIDARGSCFTGALATGGAAGPGGFAGGPQHTNAAGSGAGLTGGGGSTNNGKGGGGGGYGGSGGNGGSDPSSAGSAFGDDVITVLVGGGGGGGGGGGNAHAAPGGGGGGALQLISNTMIVVGTAGSVNAGGCGGYSSDATDSAGGGGAGGTILLEAPIIMVNGKLAVNGGGGGAGNDGMTLLGSNKGRDGAIDRIATPGYAGDGSGGDGGWGSALAGTDGVAGTKGGGGGGGVGRIRFNTRATTTLTVDNSKLSPSLADSPTTCTAGLAAVQ